MDDKIQIIDSIEKLEEFLPQWLAFLETKPLGMSVYNDPRYLLAQLKYGSDNQNKRQLHFVVVREEGAIRCIAPLVIRDHPFRLEVSVKKLFPIKVKRMQCFGGTFLYANQSDQYDRYFDTVFDELKTSKTAFDIFYFMGFRRNSPFWDYCSTRLKEKSYGFLEVLPELQHDIRIHLPDSIEALLASLTSKRRYNIKRAVKHFTEQTKSSDLLCITQSSEIENFFEQVSKISSNSWQGRTFGHTNWKTQERYQRWKSIADAGLLRSYLLMADEKPIAYRIGYQYNETYYTQESRFDQDYAELIPGIVCLYRCLENIMKETSAKIFDFDFGTLGNKELFGNEQIESMTVYITATWKGAFLARTQRAINRCIFWTKGILERWKVMDRVRKIIHKKGKKKSN